MFRLRAVSHCFETPDYDWLHFDDFHLQCVHSSGKLSQRRIRQDQLNISFRTSSFLNFNNWTLFDELWFEVIKDN